MSEQTIMEGIRDVLQGMPEFSYDDVVIADWSILDGSAHNAPFVIIDISDDFSARRPTVTNVFTWNISVTLIERFIDWNTSRLAFRDDRQAILDKFNAAGTARSAGGIDEVDIHTIRAGSEVTEIYSRYINLEQEPEALPDYLAQELTFEVTEGWA